MVFSDVLTAADTSSPIVIDTMASPAMARISSSNGDVTAPCAGIVRPASPIRTSSTAWVPVIRLGRDRIRVHAVSVEGFSPEDLGDTLDFAVPVTDLPLGMEVQSVRVSSDGVELRITGSIVAF